MARKTAETGGRYSRAGGSTKIYTVSEIVKKPGHLPHARLVLEGGLPTDELLVSVSALGDRTMWRHVK